MNHIFLLIKTADAIQLLSMQSLDVCKAFVSTYAAPDVVMQCVAIIPLFGA